MTSTRCPKCGAEQDVPTQYLGREVKCGRCSQPYTAKALPSTGASAKKSSRSVGIAWSITALVAMVSIAVIAIILNNRPGTGQSAEKGVEVAPLLAANNDLAFFDNGGNPIAYVDLDGDTTIYLWSGKPVAYLDQDSVYGFNGKHLGWFKGGIVYDNEGAIVVATASSFKIPLRLSSLRGLKALKPLKGLKQWKPLRPWFSVFWSEIPANVFFLGGVG